MTTEITTAELVRRAYTRSPWQYNAEVRATLDSLAAQGNTLAVMATSSPAYAAMTDEAVGNVIGNLALSVKDHIDNIPAENVEAAIEIARAFAQTVMTASRN